MEDNLQPKEDPLTKSYIYLEGQIEVLKEVDGAQICPKKEKIQQPQIRIYLT